MPKLNNYLQLFILVFTMPLIGSTLPADMHTEAIASIDMVYKEKFNVARTHARNIIKKYPKHPAGYFFYATVLNSEMEYLQSEKYENEFYKYCDLAIDKGEKFLEKSSDPWVEFFTAGASGYKGAYESRCENWVSAFKNGWHGVYIFKKMIDKNSGINDVEYGIATYDYWRSAKTKALWWMPGVRDKRQSAINTLKKLITQGVYVKESSASNLINILIDFKRYNDAEIIATNLLKRYPSNLTLKCQITMAQIKSGKFVKAQNGCNFIKQKISSGSFPSNYHHVLLNYFQMKIDYNSKKYTSVTKLFKELNAFQLSDIANDRLKDILSEAENISRDATRLMKKK